MPQQLTIGLFGFGVVGEGLYKILRQTPTLNAQIKKVVIKHADKARNAPDELFTTNADELLSDPEINVIVEVINETEAAFKIVSTALKNGKAVVSASKKMIAENLPRLLQIQESTGAPFLYESAACASIPVIRNLEEYYDNDLLTSIQAIVNGSTNFILSRLFDDGICFSEALKTAQELGFAETDPTLDVGGYDAAYKLQIILAHAYGIICQQNDFLFSGIQNISLRDAQYAREKGYQIKLVAQAKKLEKGELAAFVLPQFIKATHPLAIVKDEYNGVLIESGFSDQQFFYGKGAGSFPTASAVLSDISALSYNYRYAYKKLAQNKGNLGLSDDYFLNIYLSFEENTPIPLHHFDSIDEWHREAGFNYITGRISVKTLWRNELWRQGGQSLILLPDAISDKPLLHRDTLKASLEAILN